MKRRMRCGTCGTTLNSATGKPLYALVESHTILAKMDRVTECWDCGEKRREAEEAKKQARITRLLSDDAE